MASGLKFMTQQNKWRAAGAKIGLFAVCLVAGLFLFSQEGKTGCCDDVLEVWQPPASAVEGVLPGETGSACYGRYRHVKVKPGQSINAAICNVLPGGTVTLLPGVHTENIEIYKPLVLEGKVGKSKDGGTPAGGDGAYPLKDWANPNPPERNGHNDPVRDVSHLENWKAAALADGTRAVLAPSSGKYPCIKVDVDGTDSLVVVRNLTIRAPAPSTRTCIDVDAPLFVLEDSAVLGDQNDDAVVIRSGLSGIYASRIEGARVGLRIYGRYGEQSNFSYILERQRYHCGLSYPAEADSPWSSIQHAHYGPAEYAVCDSRNSGFVTGKHLIMDNLIRNNLVGMEVATGSDVAVSRNRIEYNLRAGVSNLSGGGAYSGNYIAQNGVGVEFSFDADQSTNPWPASNSTKEVGRFFRSDYAAKGWPASSPVVTGNFIEENFGAGIMVLAESVTWDMSPRSVNKLLENKIGTVWGNCIRNNTGSAIEVLGVRKRNTKRAIKGAGDDDLHQFPRNFVYSNRDTWFQRHAPDFKKTLKKKYCAWADFN